MVVKGIGLARYEEIRRDSCRAKPPLLRRMRMEVLETASNLS